MTTPPQAFATLLLMLFATQGPSPAKADEPDQEVRAEKVAKQKIITISKETTWITEPLDKEGFVNYLKAIDQRLAKGATSKNNFEVVVRSVMSPNEISEDIREEYFKRLGTPVPDANSRFLQDSSAAAKRDGGKDVREEHESISSRPWVAKEHPVAAKWVAENTKVLDRLVEGSRRSRFYTPYLTGKPDKDEPIPSMIGMMLPSIMQYREIARGLNIRAMGRIASSDLDGAWSDLQSMQRIARLTGQGPTLIEGLVAIAIDSIAFQGATHILNSPKLTREQTAKFLADLKALPPMPLMADKIDVGERFMGLDAVTMLARHGHRKGLFKTLQIIQALSFVIELKGSTYVVAQNPIEEMIARTIDWNVTLKLLNGWYDKLVLAAREPNFEKRKARFQAIQDDIGRLRADATDTKQLLKLLLTAGPRKAMGEKIGEILVALLIPAVDAARAAEDRATASSAVMQLGFALELYRRDNGSPPKSLEDLTPRYVKSIPLDPLSGDKLKYVVKDGGFTIYSVGRNGTDDGGRSQEDAEHQTPRPEWDDIVVSVGG